MCWLQKKDEEAQESLEAEVASLDIYKMRAFLRDGVTNANLASLLSAHSQTPPKMDGESG